MKYLRNYNTKTRKHKKMAEVIVLLLCVIILQMTLQMILL